MVLQLNGRAKEPVSLDGPSSPALRTDLDHNWKMDLNGPSENLVQSTNLRRDLYEDSIALFGAMLL
jgi:hypothetical protein